MTMATTSPETEQPAAAYNPIAASGILDDLFRRAGVLHADALALSDPPDRATVIGGEPRRLTFGAADRAVSALTAQLRALDLPDGSVVAFQLPNIVESYITVLAILRAGLVAAPLPLLWRRADIVAALAQVDVRALITMDRIGRCDSAATMMQVAAELFPVRFILSYGAQCPDGAVPLDGIFAENATPQAHLAPRQSDTAMAIMTFETTARGHVPIARTHGELIAGGLAVSLEASLPQGAKLLTAMPVSTFAGQSVAMIPWLLSAGRVCLHHGFSPELFRQQLRDDECQAVVVPASLLGPMTDAHFFSSHALATVLAVWREPDGMADAEPWNAHVRLIDVATFGEIGLVAVGRDYGKPPSPLRRDVGTARAAGWSIDLMRSSAGTLLVRGPMVPARKDAGEGPAIGGAGFVSDAGDTADTGYRCREDHIDHSIAVTAPPAGVVTIGGYRIARQDVDIIAGQLNGDATLAVLPHALTGQRLAAIAVDVRETLAHLRQDGVSALITSSFERSATKAA